MLWLLFLWAVYGIVFMLKYKWGFEYLRQFEFFDFMLDCAYCLGFWSGLLVWVIVQTISNAIMDIDSFIGFVLFGLLWSLASGGFCFVVDKLVEE